MYVVRLDGVGLDYSPTRLCLGLFFLSMVEMMMMRRRRKIIIDKKQLQNMIRSVADYARHMAKRKYLPDWTEIAHSVPCLMSDRSKPNLKHTPYIK